MFCGDGPREANSCAGTRWAASPHRPSVGAASGGKADRQRWAAVPHRGISIPAESIEPLIGSRLRSTEIPDVHDD